MKINVAELEDRVKKGIVKKFVDGDYIGWCYTQKCQYEKQWDEHTVLARGIVTLFDGTVISKPFPKFFNLGEPESGEIPWNEEIEVTEKIDGSLIIVSFHNGKMILNSKGSFTSEHAAFARKWIEENMTSWMNTCKHYSKSNLSSWTYCFEAVFPETENIKVINYGDRADLTLLSIFDTKTGDGFKYDELISMQDIMNNVKITPRYKFEDINTLINKCKSRSIKEGEGLVFHFIPSGKRIKVKSEEYIRLNRLISHTSRKHILDALMSGLDVESIYSSLPDELFQEVKVIIGDITSRYESVKSQAEVVTNALKQSHPTRKEQAVFIVKSPELSPIKNVIFSMLDGKDVSKAIWTVVKNSEREENINEPRLSEDAD